jgi:hypothetical protein
MVGAQGLSYTPPSAVLESWSKGVGMLCTNGLWGPSADLSCKDSSQFAHEEVAKDECPAPGVGIAMGTGQC